MKEQLEFTLSEIDTTKYITEADSTNPFKFDPPSPVIVSASGCWLTDINGKKYFDASGGSGAVNLGHQHPSVIEEGIKQLRLLTHTGWNMQSEPRLKLIRQLGNFSPYDSCAIMLAVSGTEAVEASLKIARAFTGRKNIIAFDRSFHGKSSGSLSVTSKKSFSKYAVIPDNIVHWAPYPILHLASDKQAHVSDCLAKLKDLLEQLNSVDGLPAALILEPVQAAEGMLPAGKEFLSGLLKLSKSYGCLVIYDEIYSGFCRTGSPFYASRPDLVPDLLVVGKGLGNGIPISAVMGDPQIINALPPGNHSSTFSGGPFMCATGSEVLKIMTESKLWETANDLGNQLSGFIGELSKQFPLLANIRGEGLMIGFDVVDLNGKTSPDHAKEFTRIAMEKGILFRYGGFNEATIKLTPPLIIDNTDLTLFQTAMYDVLRIMYKDITR